MAKKYRRQQRKTTPTAPPASTADTTPESASVTPATYYPARPASPRPQTTAPAQPAALKGAPDWPKEYGYVMKDLRRVSILAGCLLAALLVLSFVIQ